LIGEGKKLQWTDIVRVTTENLHTTTRINKTNAASEKFYSEYIVLYTEDGPLNILWSLKYNRKNAEIMNDFLARYTNIVSEIRRIE